MSDDDDYYDDDFDGDYWSWLEEANLDISVSIPGCNLIYDSSGKNVLFPSNSVQLTLLK
jgi:hypothetical protein